jgi:hypothetical protein
MDKRALWAERVTAWQASGLPSRDFCKGRPFSAGGLRYWASRLRQEPHVRVAAEASSTTEPSPAAAPDTVEERAPASVPGPAPEAGPAAVAMPAPVPMVRVVRRRSGSQNGPARPKPAPRTAASGSRETCALVLEWGALRLAVEPGFDPETLGAVLDLLAERGGTR